jgi:hypothetical protein
MKPILAWYFSDESKKIHCGDGADIAIGVEHTLKDLPALRYTGLHGCESILAALNCASGPIVWRVELSGKINRVDDKIAATRRKYVAGGIDISDILRAFSRKQYLETGYESLRDAANNANSAVDAAASAAEAASIIAANTAKESAWATVNAANTPTDKAMAVLDAWDYANSAATYAAAAAKAKAEKMLESMVQGALK